VVDVKKGAADGDAVEVMAIWQPVTWWCAAPPDEIRDGAPYRDAEEGQRHRG